MKIAYQCYWWIGCISLQKDDTRHSIYADATVPYKINTGSGEPYYYVWSNTSDRVPTPVITEYWSILGASTVWLGNTFLSIYPATQSTVYPATKSPLFTQPIESSIYPTKKSALFIQGQILHCLPSDTYLFSQRQMFRCLPCVTEFSVCPATLSPPFTHRHNLLYLLSEKVPSVYTGTKPRLFTKRHFSV
jgi:hypothetical protein